MGLISLLRSLIPLGLRAPLKQVYAYIPLEKRMEREYWQLKAFLREAQWWDRERIDVWQLEKLKEVVRHAYQNVPGYYALYRDAGVKPDDIVSSNDIRLLPFVTKGLIRDNLEDFTARDLPSWRRKHVTTGGSTGIPLGFYHTDVNLWVENAFMHSGWEWAGWQIGDMSAVLRGDLTGSQKKIWSYDPGRRELFLSSYHLTESTYKQYITILQKYSPKHLQAYPSVVTLLADLILKFGDVGKVDFKTILLGSENIYKWQKSKLAQAFPKTRIFAWYGHTEQVILSPICEHSDQYHIWPFYGFTEILKEKNKNTEVGEIGELVGTSFWNKGTPFIRYRTEDFAQRGQAACSKCNRQFDLLRHIEGRKQDYVVTIDGGYVTLTALIFSQHFHAFGVIRSMQLYQDSVGEVIVKIVPTDAYSDIDSSEIKTRMETAVGGRLSVQVELVDEITRTRLGKYRFLEQKLDIKYGE
jgi:phenylacetate-CoA ligase